MRTIKFRAWDTVLNTMYGLSTSLSDRFSIRSDGMANDNFILMQFTGLKDKNGKEIFEGDLVECKTPYGDLVKEIIWDSERCGFFMKSSFVAYDSKNLYKLSNKKMLVIGNIYET